MHKHIFRKYDIRGKIGLEIKLEEVYRLAQAIAYYFHTQNPHVKTVALGADGRLHSPAIKAEVCKALQESGLDVVYIGTCPTPVMYFALFRMPVDAGLMITASHNGKEYNGIKMCLGKESVWGQQIQTIRQLTENGAALEAPKHGSYKEYNLINDYVNWLVEHFSHLKAMPLSAVVDCGNGAAGTVWPQLIDKMNWKNVQLLFEKVDGNYPNHEADPTVEDNMLVVKKLLRSGSFDVGLGLDGDCDRMTPMTKHGELVHGDKLLALFAQKIVQENPGASVVFDIKCSSGLSEVLTHWGARPCMVASGHSIIKTEMKKNKALLAGELSCHFFFKDRYFGYDDGNYAAMRLFELLVEHKASLEDLLSMFPKKFNTPEIRLACRQEDMEAILNSVKKHFFEQKDVEIMTTDGIRVNIKHGWGLLRASNTQPVICLRFESDTSNGLLKLKSKFATLLEPYFPQKTLIQTLR